MQVNTVKNLKYLWLSMQMNTIKNCKYLFFLEKCVQIVCKKYTSGILLQDLLWISVINNTKTKKYWKVSQTCHIMSQEQRGNFFRRGRNRKSRRKDRYRLFTTYRIKWVDICSLHHLLRCHWDEAGYTFCKNTEKITASHTCRHGM